MGTKQIIGWFKAAVLFFIFVGTAFVFSVLVLFRWGDLSLNQKFVRTFATLANKWVGLEVTVIDSHKIKLNQPCVYIGNHQSGMDFALAGMLAPSNMVIIGKREVLYIPFLGWFLLGAGNILIDRKSGTKAHQALQTVVERMKKDRLTLAIMPEGTRNRGNTHKLLPFKKGAFHVAVAGQFPIVPVVCTSLEGKAMWEKGELFGGKVLIKVLDPIPTQGKTQTDIDSLIHDTRTAMQKELDELHVQLEKEESTN